MKNTRLKNVIFTAGMAIFTGVLLLGVNAAIGAATPTVDPPGAGVSPTFTGLDVQGMVQNTSANNGGGVVVDDNLQITGSTWIDDLIVQGVSTFEGAVTIDGDFESRGGNFRGVVGNSDGDFYVDDDMTVDGDANISGNLQVDTISSDRGTLLVNNMLRIAGGLIIDGPRSRFDGEFINVNAILRANNGIINASSAPAPVTVNDNFVVTGTSDLRGNVSDSGGSFTVDDNMTVTGSQQVDGNLTVSNDANMNGNFTVGASSPDVARTITLNGNTTIRYNTTLSGDVDLRGSLSNQVNGADVRIVDGLDVHGTIKNTSTTPPVGVLAGSLPRPVTIDDNLVVTGDATINQNLRVNGVARASRFGTVTVRSTDRTNVNNNSNVSLNQPCNAGEELLSCGANTFNNNFTWDYNKDFVIKAVFPWTNDTCYGRARNESGFAKRFSVYAVCLDPDL